MTQTNTVKTLIATLVAALLLSACGIAEDRVPRDIDPQKQEELNNP